jgi:KDO2-lipid IV(A) lauroyltransferase
MLPSARVVRAAIAAARVVPPRVAYAVAWLAGSLGYVLARARRRVLLQNVASLRPELRPAERQRTALRTFINFFQAAVDLFRLPSMPREVLERLVVFNGRQHLDAAMGYGKGALLVTSHLGPYELGAAVIAASGYPSYAMVEDLDPETNRALAQYREATGLKLFSRDLGPRSMYRLLEQGNVVLLVGDRIVGHGSEGIAMAYGGGRRRIPSGPAAFSIATGAPIIVGHITRTATPFPRYEITLEPPILPPERTPEATRELTSLVGRRLAAAATMHPDQWYVFQPEWLASDGTT